MNWVYYGKLFDSKFQAGCLAERFREDWWTNGYKSPAYVGIYRTNKGRYGVKYLE
jgi:hypothetical protein